MLRPVLLQRMMGLSRACVAQRLLTMNGVRRQSSSSAHVFERLLLFADNHVLAINKTSEPAIAIRTHTVNKKQHAGVGLGLVKGKRVVGLGC